MEIFTEIFRKETFVPKLGLLAVQLLKSSNYLATRTLLDGKIISENLVPVPKSETSIHIVNTDKTSEEYIKDIAEKIKSHIDGK